MNIDFSRNPLAVIAGPTAVGKSEAAVLLAKRIGGEVVSADSMQVYRGMDIGTAKVTAEEMGGVPHHLIDCADIDDDYNVTVFKENAKAAVEDILSRKKVPVICGGTGFYIQALLYDIDFTKEETDEEYRKSLWDIAEKNGAEFLHEKLREADPRAAEEIHYNNIKRVIRALEYHHLTGERISDHNEREKKRQSPYDVCFFVLTDDRQKLYDRIDRRVDIMMERGLLSEVEGLKNAGARRESTAMQGLGYKQILNHLYGECSLDEAVYRIKLESRHYAKRQITWFKRERDVIWINRTDHPDVDGVLDVMTEHMKKWEI